MVADVRVWPRVLVPSSKVRDGHVAVANEVPYIVSMSKTEILEELPKLTKTERQEIRLRLAELDSDDWLDNDDPLTVQERALLEARLAAYSQDPDAGQHMRGS